jgi:enoyl-CoA hydratase/carnithine racemase
MADDTEDPHDVDVYAAPRQAAYQHIHFDTVQGISRITLNRPPANVLSVEVMEELNGALESLEYRREVKLVVLTAAGKYFSAGFDLSDHLGDRAYVMVEEFRKIFENLAKLDKPTLGVVAGAALGAGSVLAAGCDITLAGASVRFGLPEIKGGVFNSVGVALLPRLVGRKKAFELILSGGALSAAEAERAGLISRAVPDEKLDEEVAALVSRFQEGSAPVFQLVRRALVSGMDLPLIDAVRQAEDIYLNQLMATDDMEEGLKAVMEKRKPAWKDK